MDGYRFKNWAQTYECSPQKFFDPCDLDELRSILRLARDNGKKLRMVGYGHSPSDLCCTDEFLVSNRKLDQILNLDEERRVVSVETGVLLKDLVQFLKSQNLALASLPAIGELTIGGLVSTCTHGSGVEYTVLAGSVTKITLLTADDELITCSRDENDDIFHAVCGGLGTLGIIVSLDLQCEPYYKLSHLRYPMVFDDFVNSIDELSVGSDHFKAFYYPYADRFVASDISRTKALPTVRPRSLRRRCVDWFWRVFVLVYLLEFFYFLATFAPFLVKYINRAAYRYLFSDSDYCVDGYERIAFFDCLFHQYVSEWAVERSKCAEALRRLRDVIHEKNIPAHFPIEVRFIRRDSFWLSPAYERDVCYINIIAFCPYEKKPAYEDYWAAFHDIMKSMDGRPHLAKDHNMTQEDMRRAYPRFDDFLSLRKRLDPKNMFVNGYIGRVFGTIDDQTSDAAKKSVQWAAEVLGLHRVKAPGLV